MERWKYQPASAAYRANFLAVLIGHHRAGIEGRRRADFRALITVEFKALAGADLYQVLVFQLIFVTVWTDAPHVKIVQLFVGVERTPAWP